MGRKLGLLWAATLNWTVQTWKEKPDRVIAMGSTVFTAFAVMVSAIAAIISVISTIEAHRTAEFAQQQLDIVQRPYMNFGDISIKALDQTSGLGLAKIPVFNTGQIPLRFEPLYVMINDKTTAGKASSGQTLLYQNQENTISFIYRSDDFAAGDEIKIAVDYWPLTTNHKKYRRLRTLKISAGKVANIIFDDEI